MATILIADDDLVNRKLLKTILTYEAYRVLQATDGSEALAKARAEWPDLVSAGTPKPAPKHTFKSPRTMKSC